MENRTSARSEHLSSGYTDQKNDILKKVLIVFTKDRQLGIPVRLRVFSCPVPNVAAVPNSKLYGLCVPYNVATHEENNITRLNTL